MTPDYGWRMKATGALVLVGLCAPMFFLVMPDWAMPIVSILIMLAGLFLVALRKELEQSR